MLDNQVASPTIISSTNLLKTTTQKHYGHKGQITGAGHRINPSHEYTDV